MALETLLAALENQPFAVAIVEGESLFPWIETVHVIAIVTVVGTISVVDLRLLGVKAHVQCAQRLMTQLLPATWIAFAIALISGLLMFSSKASKYAANGPFQAKMLLLLLAGANMVLFHVITHKHIETWDVGKTPPSAKLAGALSLVLWTLVIACGRWIGFTVH
jgi:hypothetical protein